MGSWWSLRHAFVDTNLHLAFLLGLSGKRCKEIKRLAVRLQQAQRVPAGTHDEVCTGVDHGPQIARPRIAAIAQHDIARPVGRGAAGSRPRARRSTQADRLDRLPGRSRHAAAMSCGQPRFADRRPIERTQAIPGPSSRWHFRLFGNQRCHDVAKPRPRFAQPLEQRWIGQAGDPAGLSPRTGLAQRHAEAAIGKRQPQQRLGVLDLPRPREGPTRPRRRFHVKIRRKARAQLPASDPKSQDESSSQA